MRLEIIRSETDVGELYIHLLWSFASNMRSPEIMLAIIIGGRSDRSKGWEALRTCSMIIPSKIIAIIAIHRLSRYIVLAGML